jgi:hypothetical protein
LPREGTRYNGEAVFTAGDPTGTLARRLMQLAGFGLGLAGFGLGLAGFGLGLALAV